MNYNKKSIEDIEVAGKRVLCRCDFNVPTNLLLRRTSGFSWMSRHRAKSVKS